MCQSAQLAAIMCGFRDRVAVALQQLVDLVEQVAAARRQAWDVLEHDEVDRVVGPGFAHEPYATQRERVQRLVLGGLAHFLGQQAGSALAGAADEDDIRALVAGGAPDVRRPCFTPCGRRFLAVEGGVLFAGEQVHDGAADARLAIEVPDCGRRNIDAAKATEARRECSDTRAGLVEPLRCPADTAAKMEVGDVLDQGAARWGQQAWCMNRRSVHMRFSVMMVGCQASPASAHTGGPIGEKEVPPISTIIH